MVFLSMRFIFTEVGGSDLMFLISSLYLFQPSLIGMNVGTWLETNWAGFPSIYAAAANLLHHNSLSYIITVQAMLLSCDWPQK